MKVVLQENIKGLGKKLDVVEVSEGYARNFLLPRKKAILADNKGLSEATSKKASIDFKRQTAINEAKQIKEKLDNALIQFELKAKNGKFFGSVTSKEISEKLMTVYSINVDKKKIELEDSVKSPGIYTAKVKLFEGVVANLKVKVLEI